MEITKRKSDIVFIFYVLFNFALYPILSTIITGGQFTAIDIVRTICTLAVIAVMILMLKKEKNIAWGALLLTIISMCFVICTNPDYVVLYPINFISSYIPSILVGILFAINKTSTSVIASLMTDVLCTGDLIIKVISRYDYLMTLNQFIYCILTILILLVFVACKAKENKEEKALELEEQRKQYLVNLANNSNEQNSDDNLDALIEYKELLDSGVITQEEFDQKKAELLK